LFLVIVIKKQNAQNHDLFYFFQKKINGKPTAAFRRIRKGKL